MIFTLAAFFAASGFREGLLMHKIYFKASGFWHFFGTAPARVFACVMLAALTLVCGCAGSRLPDPADADVSAMRAADPGFIKKEFVDAKFSAAFESRDPEKIRALFDRSLARCAHWKNLFELACSLNDVRLETSGLEASVRQPGDGGTVIDVSFDYKLYGFTGLEYDIFVKEGRTAFAVRTSDDGASGAGYRIISDAFAGHCHLRGSVADGKGLPVGGAAVTVETEKRSYSCTTGYDGAFSIEFIDSPSATVRIDKTGFKPFEKKLEGMKKGEYSPAGDLVVTPLPNVSVPREAGEAEGPEARGALSPGAETRCNRLSATAMNKSVRLSWPDLKTATGRPHSYKLYRRGPSEEKFKLIFSSPDSSGYTDEGLANGGVYLYRVDAFVSQESGRDPVQPSAGPAALTSFGPVASVPASLKLAFEFEDILAGSPKWTGVRPRIVNARQFSGGSYVAFDPLKTQALSFLSPRKIKNGYYRAFLYAERSGSNSSLKIEIKQFGEPEDTRSFYRGEVSLKSSVAEAGRDVIDLGEMLIESKSWKNEPIGEDYCEISIRISRPEDAEKDAEDPAANGGGKKVSLDVIEFVKID